MSTTFTCPFCAERGQENEAKMVRSKRTTSKISRRYECQCGARFTTNEQVEINYGNFNYKGCNIVREQPVNIKNLINNLSKEK